MTAAEDDADEDMAGQESGEEDLVEEEDAAPVPSAVPKFNLGSLASAEAVAKKKPARRSAKKDRDEEDDLVEIGATTDSGADASEVWQEIQAAGDTLLQQVAKALGGSAPNCLLGLLPAKTLEECKVGHQLKGVFRLQPSKCLIFSIVVIRV